jgi:hypothetical protein
MDTSSATSEAIPGEAFVRQMKLLLPAAPRAFYRLKITAP